MTRPYLVAGLLLALVLGQALSVQAEQLIDTFDTTVQLLQRNTVGITSGSAAAPEALGGQRDLALTVSVAPMGGTSHTLGTNLAGSQRLEYFETNGNGSFSVVWDGDSDPNTIDYAGLMDFDLTEGGVNTGILLRIVADLTTDLSLVIYDSAADFSTITHNLPGGGGLTDVFFSFADFVPTGNGADFSSVGAIQLSIADGPSGNDVQIDFISAVPEPGGLLLFATGAALLTLGAPRRRRQG